MKKLRHCLFFIVCVLSSVSVLGQDSLTVEVPLFENLVLSHNRKGGCYPGDTIRFEVKITENAQSKVVYVDFLYPTGDVIETRKLKLDDQNCAVGEVTVDALFGSGFYQLRAYTRYNTNWTAMTYPYCVIPVFSLAEKSPDSKLKSGQHIISQYVTKRGKQIHVTDLFSINRYVDVANQFILRQPVEKGLLVFGKIQPKRLQRMENPDLEDKTFNVAVSRGKQMFGGKVTTDVNGYFGISLPDTLTGVWNLFMYEKRSAVKGVFATEQLAPFRVCFLDDFTIRGKALTAKEIQPERFGCTKWVEDKQQNKIMTQFINCDKLTLRRLNKGVIPENIYRVLGMENGNFTHTMGVSSPSVMNVAPDTAFSRVLDMTFPNGRDSNDPRTVCKDGIGYKGRPVVWIVDGAYRMVTCMNKPITDFAVLKPSKHHIPQFVDEVQSIFITDDINVCRSFVRCSEMEKRHPVVVCIRTHGEYIWNDSGLFSSHFRGYDR